MLRLEESSRIPRIYSWECQERNNELRTALRMLILAMGISLAALLDTLTFSSAQGLRQQSSPRLPAAQASVVILSPDKDSQVLAHKPLPVVFRATPGSGGDHVHLLVDGVLVRMLPIRGAYSFSGSVETRYILTDGLYPGHHTITVGLVDAAHASIGVNASVTVVAVASR
jgi:hypothetical protein